MVYCLLMDTFVTQEAPKVEWVYVLVIVKLAITVLQLEYVCEQVEVQE